MRKELCSALAAAACCLSLAAQTTTTTQTFSSYVANGDSITYGYPLTASRYPSLVASRLGIQSVNVTANVGDQACDVFPRALYVDGITVQGSAQQLFSLMVGTNDVDKKGTGPYESTYRLCHTALLALTAIPSSSLLQGGNGNVSGAGGWSAGADAGDKSFTFGGMYATAGGTLTFSPGAVSVPTPTYIFYSLDDAAPASAVFNVTDERGTLLGSASAMPPVSMATANGTTRSLGVLRVVRAPGTSQLIASTPSGGVSIYGVGSIPRPLAAGAPVTLSGDVPNQLQGNPVATAAQIAAYNADIAADEGVVQGDGAAISHVYDDLYMLGTAAEMNNGDPLHLSAVGDANMASAFVAAVPLVTSSASASMPLTGGSLQVATNEYSQFCSGSCTVGANVSEIVTFGDTTVLLPAPPAGFPTQRITVISFAGGTATLALPAGWSFYGAAGGSVSAPAGHSVTVQSFNQDGRTHAWFQTAAF